MKCSHGTKSMKEVPGWYAVQVSDPPSLHTFAKATVVKKATNGIHNDGAIKTNAHNKKSLPHFCKRDCIFLPFAYCKLPAV